MTTQREHPSEFGPRVIGGTGGRPVSSDRRIEAIRTRVAAVRERLGLTWAEFDERLGLSEKRQRSRGRRQRPTPYTAAELAAISMAFGVSGDYLLRGTGEMFTTEDQGPDSLALSAALHRHASTLASGTLDLDPEAIETILGAPNDLLVQVEQALIEAVRLLIQAKIQDSKLANRAIRDAVASHVAASRPQPGPTPEHFRQATRGMISGKVIDPGP